MGRSFFSTALWVIGAATVICGLTFAAGGNGPIPDLLQAPPELSTDKKSTKDEQSAQEEQSAKEEHSAQEVDSPPAVQQRREGEEQGTREPEVAATTEREEGQPEAVEQVEDQGASGELSSPPGPANPSYTPPPASSVSPVTAPATAPEAAPEAAPAMAPATAPEAAPPLPQSTETAGSGTSTPPPPASDGGTSPPPSDDAAGASSVSQPFGNDGVGVDVPPPFGDDGSVLDR